MVDDKRSRGRSPARCTDQPRRATWRHEQAQMEDTQGKAFSTGTSGPSAIRYTTRVGGGVNNPPTGPVRVGRFYLGFFGSKICWFPDHVVLYRLKSLAVKNFHFIQFQGNRVL